jgi:Flp pilus assembly pilin Flp
MSNILGLAKLAMARFRSDESGQDALEYLLVIGVIMVAVVGAASLGLGPDGLVDTIITAITGAVTTLISTGGGS